MYKRQFAFMPVLLSFYIAIQYTLLNWVVFIHYREYIIAFLVIWRIHDFYAVEKNGKSNKCDVLIFIVIQ